MPDLYMVHASRPAISKESRLLQGWVRKKKPNNQQSGQACPSKTAGRTLAEENERRMNWVARHC